MVPYGRLSDFWLWCFGYFIAGITKSAWIHGVQAAGFMHSLSLSAIVIT
jgi:hypothetical protein